VNIKVYALMRSGHHAIAFWLAKNLRASVDFMDVDGRKNMVYEDSPLTLDLYENEELKASDEPVVIILRDPFNNYASFKELVKNPNYGPLSFFPFLERWKSYARECVGETNFFSNKVYITYNTWTTSLEYRKAIVDTIGRRFGVATSFDDSLRQHMTKYGGYSSFDGRTYIDSASMMKVNERYKFYEGSAAYRENVDTPEIRELSEKLFDFYPFKPLEKRDSGMTQLMFNDLFL